MLQQDSQDEWTVDIRPDSRRALAAWEPRGSKKREQSSGSEWVKQHMLITISGENCKGKATLADERCPTIGKEQG